jgi:hypothetical protein
MSIDNDHFSRSLADLFLFASSNERSLDSFSFIVYPRLTIIKDLFPFYPRDLPINSKPTFSLFNFGSSTCDSSRKSSSFFFVIAAVFSLPEFFSFPVLYVICSFFVLTFLLFVYRRDV